MIRIKAHVFITELWSEKEVWSQSCEEWLEGEKEVYEVFFTPLCILYFNTGE